MQFKSIQVFRGLASLLVLLFHITMNIAQTPLKGKFFFGFFTFGGAGVDFFFVLSGFIIFYSSDKLLKQNKYATYIKNRLTRIYPIYFIIAGCLLLVHLLYPQFFGVPFNFSWINTTSTLFLLPGHTMVNGVSWSLSFELYFYLFFLLAFGITSRLVSYSLVGIYALLIIFAGFIGLNKSSFFLSPLILDFFLGLVIIPVSRILVLKNLGFILQVLGAVLFFLFGFLYYRNALLLDSEFKRVAYYGLPSFMILTGSFLLEKDKTTSAPRVLLLLGDMSYSLYLIHLPLVVLSVKVIRQSTITNSVLVNLVFILVIGLILLIVYLFHIMVEKPIMNAFKSRNKAINSTK